MNERTPDCSKLGFKAGLTIYVWIIFLQKSCYCLCDETLCKDDTKINA